MTRFLVCPACGHHEPSAGAAGEDDTGDASDDGDGGGEDDAGDASDDDGGGGEDNDGDASDDGGDANGHRHDGDSDGAPADDEGMPDCPRCGSRRTYRHDDSALPDAETEAYVKFDTDSVGEG